MAESDNNSNPTFTDAQVTVITKIVGEALKPHATEVAGMKESIDKLGTGVTAISESVGKLTDAGAGGDKKKAGDAETAETALTAESVGSQIAKALQERDTASQATAQQREANAAWLKANAPKVADDPLIGQLIASAKTDEDRQAVIDQWTASFKASGATVPDIGATSAEADSSESQDASAGKDTAQQEQEKIAEIRQGKVFAL